MSMNHIQFQPSLTMPDFLKQFGTEEQCETELERARWPQGFVCPCCTHMGLSVFKVELHKTFQCQSEPETIQLSCPPSGIAPTPDSGKLKPLDNQDSIRSHDGHC